MELRKPNRLRPWLLGVMSALFVARPLFPSESVALMGDGLPVVMLWITLAVFWLLGAIGRPKFYVRFGLTDAAVLLLIGLHTLAAVWAAMHLSPRPAVNMLWEWIGLGLAFFLARQLITGEREARAVVAVMIALAVALSGYGLYQYFYEMPTTRAQYAADPDRAMREAGLWYPPDSPQRQQFENRLQSTEPIATFALTNSLAGYLAPWLVVLAGIAVGGAVGGDSSRRSNGRSAVNRTSIGDRSHLLQGRLAVVCCVVPIAACLVLTKSRSGYVATGLGLLLVWLLCGERKKRLGWKLPLGIGALGAILLAATVATGGLDRQVLSEASKSLGYRVQYWRSTLKMIAEKPMVGCGPGNFQNTYTMYKLPEASEEVADPHNFLLEVWATAGTPALLALLAVLCCFAWKSRRKSICNSQFAIFNLQFSDVHIILGAACGFLLAVPLGLLSAAPPGIAAVLLGLPLAAACLALLAGWIGHGRLPPLLPAIGVVVLLVNLLAAGGIGFPGVAGSLWLLLALGLQGDRPRMLPRSIAFGLLGIALTLAVACYSTAYGPVLRCQGEMRAAWRKPSEAEKHLQAAAVADPLCGEPWRQLAAIAFEDWWKNHDDKSFHQFEQYNATALELAANSAPAWLASGNWYARAYAKTGRQAEIDNAVAAYRRAVHLYPNSALYRAKLALAHRSADNQADFRREADAALRLDRLTPHADKKLPEDIRRCLAAGLARRVGTGVD